MDKQTLIEAAIIPAGAALFVAAVLFFLARRDPEKSPAARLGVLVVPVAYLVGHLVHYPQPDWLNWPSVDAWQWLAPGVALMALACVATALYNRAWLKRLLRLIVLAALAGISLQSYMRFTWTPADSALWISGIAIGGTLWWIAVEAAGYGPRGNWFTLQWLLLTIGCAAIFVLSKSARFAEICMMLGAGVGATMVLQMAGRRTLAAGLYGVAPLILIGLWLNGYFYAELTWWRILVPAAAPLVAPISSLSFLRRKMRWLGPLTATVVCALIIAAAVTGAVMTYEPDPYGGAY